MIFSRTATGLLVFAPILAALLAFDRLAPAWRARRTIDEDYVFDPKRYRLVAFPRSACLLILAAIAAAALGVRDHPLLLMAAAIAALAGYLYWSEEDLRRCLELKAAP